MITKRVAVTIIVEVTVDEAKLDEQFMTEFRKQMYHLTSLDAHIEHLAQTHARGLYDNESFIEGYGQASEMGIKFNELRVENSEIVNEDAFA